MNSKTASTFVMIFAVSSLLLPIQSSFANPVLQTGAWTKIFGDHACGIGIDPTNPSTIYLGVNGGFAGGTGSTSGIYKTTDGGSNWKRIGQKTGVTGSVEFGNDVFPFVDPKDPSHLYGYTGVSGDYGFFVSHDAGATWATPKDWYDVQTRVGITSSSGMNDCYGLAPDPTDFNHLLVTFHSPWSWAAGHGVYSGNAGVLESTDGGTTWIPHDPMDGFSQGNGIGMLYNPAKGIGDSKTWLFGSQGSGYWRTTNAGTTWTKLNTANQTHGGCQMYAASSGAFYVTAVDGILRSTDGGANWQHISNSNGLPGSYFLGITGDGTNLYTCPSTGGSVYTSLDNDGLTWKKLNTQTFTNGPVKMACDKVNGIVYASCSPDGLWAIKVPVSSSAISNPQLSVPHTAKVERRINEKANRMFVSIGVTGRMGKSGIYDIRGRIVGIAGRK
jgi:photosystem II stability/assembly factor-like uncharacterized protein